MLRAGENTPPWGGALSLVIQYKVVSHEITCVQVIVNGQNRLYI